MFETIDYFNEKYWELARSLDLSGIDAALVAEGWEKKELDDRVIYRRPKEENSRYGVDLPKPTDEYYVPTLLHAASDYALYLDKPIEEVLDRWRTLRFDRARFRIVTDEAQEGEIPLERIRDLADGVVSAIACAVKDVESPASAHKRVASSAITELSKRARFGLTEKGSYVVNALVPLEETKEDGELPNLKTRLFRKGLEHLAASFELAERTADDSNDTFLDANKEIRASANLLEAFSKTSFEGNADVEFSVDWSPLVAPTPDVPSRVLLKKETAAKLKERATALRPKKEETREFFAKVVALEDLSKSDDERPSGAVSFCIEDEDADYKADAMLDADAFQTAGDAMFKRATVAFNARVTKASGKATINGVANLRIVETPSFE